MVLPAVFCNAAQADALSTSNDPFTDVPASHWAAGYIAYCAQRGIINGMGDGTFAPDSPVTGLQFAKMLLCALGYNANDEYVSDDWSIKVSKDALTLELFKSNLGGATNTPATREECALYAFNILEKEKVSYSALLGGYITSGTQWGNAASANEKNTIADDFELIKLTDDDDDFGRLDGHRWCVKNKNNIISAYYGESDDLKASYSTEVTGADIAALLGKAFIDDVTDGTGNTKNHFEVYLNGDDSASGIDKDDLVKSNTKALEGTGNGVETLVYAGTKGSGKDAESWIRIVIVDTYLAKVEDVTAGTSKKDPKTTVTVLNGWEDGASKDYALDLDTKGFNTDKFDEDDYVLITVANGSIKSMEAANTKESTISRYNKSGDKITVTAGGTDYVAAKNTAYNDDLDAANDNDTVNRNIVNGEKHTLYYDNYGYLIAVADVEADSDYVYAAHFGTKSDSSGDFDDNNVAVKLYYADGTSKIVTLNTKSTVNGDDVFKGVTADDVDDLNNNNLGIYKLTMKSGKAVLSSDGIDTTGGDPVKKGISSIGGNKADNKTVFFYVTTDLAWNDDDFEVRTFTGINSVPTNKDKEDNKADTVSVILDGTKVKAALVNDELEGDTTDTVYFFTGDYDVNENNWTVTYETYVDGKYEPLKISYKDKEEKDDKVALFVGDDAFVGKFFTLNSKNEPIDTKIAESNGDPKKVNKSFYDDELTPEEMSSYDLTDDNGVVYAIDGMKIIDVTGNEDTVSSISALKKLVTNGDNTLEIAVQYADNSSNTIAYLYLVTNDEP